MSLETGKWVDTTPNKGKKISMSDAINIWLLSILFATSWVWNATWEEISWLDRQAKIDKLNTDLSINEKKAIDNNCVDGWREKNILTCMEITWEGVDILNELSTLMSEQAREILSTPIRINKQ